MILDSPYYVPNMVIQRDFQTPTVLIEIRHHSSVYSARLKQSSSKPHGGTRKQAIIYTFQRICLLYSKCNCLICSLVLRFSL
jgi:hypothetical protein